MTRIDAGEGEATGCYAGVALVGKGKGLYDLSPANERGTLTHTRSVDAVTQSV